MSYRDPKAHREQLRFRAASNDWDRVALAKYGMSFYDLPSALCYSIVHEFSPPHYSTGRRFKNHNNDHRAGSLETR